MWDNSFVNSAFVCLQTEEEIKIKREHEIDLRHWQAANNVLTALTKYEGSADEKEILKVGLTLNLVEYGK